MSSKNRPKGTAVSEQKSAELQTQETAQVQSTEELQSTDAGAEGAGEGAAADQGQPEQGTGDTVDAEAAAKGDATQDAPAPAPAAEGEVSAFQQLIAKIRAEGAQSAKVVVDTMEDYMQAMKPGLPVSDEQVIQHQTTLWRLIQRVLNDENYEAMAAGLDMLIAYFKEYRKTALAEIYVFRGAELLTLAAEQAQAFHAALNVLHIAAGTGVKSVQKHADLNRSFTEQVYSDTARNNIQAYFLA